MSETAGVQRLTLPPPGRMLDMACRCCGARRVELVLDLTDQPHCNRLVRPDLAPRAEPHFPLRLGFCRDCTLVQIDHTIPKEKHVLRLSLRVGHHQDAGRAFPETAGGSPQPTV